MRDDNCRSNVISSGILAGIAVAIFRPHGDILGHSDTKITQENMPIC
jgi:hypothetical protein